MSKQSPPIQRSWTAEDEGGSGKWLLMSLLLVLLGVGIYFLVTSLRWKSHPNVFVATFCVEEYNTQLLPEPAYAAWNIDEALETFEAQGVNRWTALTHREMTSEAEVRGKWATLASELQDRYANPRDTLVVYIRANALAFGGDVHLLANDFSNSGLKELNASQDGNEASLENAVRLSRVLADLQELPVANVVVFADFCDLAAMPKLGIMVNDVPSALASTTNALSGKTPLWIVTSCSSFEPAHVSYKQKRTLLQAACEYACSSSVASKSQDFVSLANLYETIVRYSSEVTDAAQTPLLLRSGFGSVLTGSELASDPWEEAMQVSVGRVERTPDAGETRGEGPSDSGAEDSDDSATIAAADGEESELELTPSLKFWQLHNRLSSRTSDLGGWSPVDFAVQRWRKYERDAALFTKKGRISGRQSSSEIGALHTELQEFESTLENSGQEATGEGQSDLASDWKELTVALSHDRARLAWTAPDILEPSLRGPWLDARDGYRNYFDAMSRLAGWLELALVEPPGQRSELLTLVDRQISTLMRIERALPKQNSDALLGHRLPKPLLGELKTTLLEMERYAEDRIENLLGKIGLARLAEGDKLTWAAETQITLLLASPNIPFEHRKRLAWAYDALNRSCIIQPGVNVDHVGRQETLGKMLGTAVNRGSPDFYQNWSRVLSRALALADQSLPSFQAGDAEVVNEWGITTGQRLHSNTSRSAEQSSSAIRSWKLACVADLLGVRADEDQLQDGLLLAASDDLGLYVSAGEKRELQLKNGSNDLTLDVSHCNGRTVDSCWFRYEIDENSESESGRELRVRVRAGRSLVPGELHRVALVRGQLPLSVELARNSTKADALPEPVKRMRLTLSAGENKRGVEETIKLLPPRPNQVSLLAKQIDVSGIVVSSAASAPSGEGWFLRQLEVPAIGHESATAQYELNLVNLSATKKLVQVKLFAVQGPNGTAGNGKVTSAAMVLTNSRRKDLTPILESAGTISLDASIISADASREGKRFSLVSKAPEGNAQSTSGEFGLLCVIEEVTQSDERAPMRTGVEWLHWIDCVPKNPAGTLVAILPQEVEREFSFRLALSPAALSTWRTAALQIDGFISNAEGQRVPVSGESSVALTKEEPVKTLILRPDRTPGGATFPGSRGKLFAHLTIQGYQRATTYESRLRGLSPGSENTAVANEPFVWLDSDALGLALATSPTQSVALEAWPGRRALVVPTQIGSNEASTGEPAEYAGLTVPVRVDFPPGGNSQVTFSLGSTKVSYSVDRKFLPRLDVLGGNLLFSASVTDLSHQFPNINHLRGKQSLEVVVESPYRDVRRDVDVVFDRAAPSQSRVQLDKNTLYLNETLNITLETATPNGDNDTPLVPSRVFFAIDQTSLGGGKYDAGDELLNLKVQSPSGRLTAILKAEQLEAFARGEYRIVARTIDLAGNVQDANLAARFKWIPTERPVAIPKVEPKKPKPQPAAAKKYTVQVQVKLDDKSLTPAQFRNTEVSGISAAVKAYPQGIWVYTLVPEGGYKVKATLVANGKKYEGTANISVTSHANVPIALKPAL